MPGFSFESHTMELNKAIINILCIIVADGLLMVKSSDNSDIKRLDNKDQNVEDVFNGVYTECFMQFSYACIQNKTLLYLKELNRMSEVSLIGSYVKLVKLNTTKHDDNETTSKGKTSKELSFMIDDAVDRFFDNHVLKFNVMGRNVSVPSTVEEFVGRKKRKGGGGGGGGGGHGGDDGGKKKMMMMAMMCMKMKLMMMLPAMMGMMGMMSFKGMMFSMMSFMVSKMMLLMKLLEKKGGGAGGGGVGDGGWPAAGGGGGAWMPAGGQDFGGAGGGYDANAQWQSRKLLENVKTEVIKNPIVSFVTPTLRYHNKFMNDKKFDDITGTKITDRINAVINKPKSRKKRGIIDILQNSYLYWMNKFLGVNNNRRTQTKYPKFKIVNGIKYVYQPFKMIPKLKSHELTTQVKNIDEGFKPIITADDFNKGEIVEGGVESRMIRKKFHKMKDTVNETMDDNPWE